MYMRVSEKPNWPKLARKLHNSSIFTIVSPYFLVEMIDSVAIFATPICHHANHASINEIF